MNVSLRQINGRWAFYDATGSVVATAIQAAAGDETSPSIDAETIGKMEVADLHSLGKQLGDDYRELRFYQDGEKDIPEGSKAGDKRPLAGDDDRKAQLIALAGQRDLVIDRHNSLKKELADLDALDEGSSLEDTKSEGGEGDEGAEGGSDAGASEGEGSEGGEGGGDSADGAGASGDKKEPVSSSANDSGAGGKSKPPAGGAKDKTKTAPIFAGAGAEGGGASIDAQGRQLLSPADFTQRMQTALRDTKKGANQANIVATVDRFPDLDHSARLGANPTENHRVLYGPDSEQLIVTAAVCGPPEPIREIPFCFTDEEPVLDAITSVPAKYGQIQVYSPLSLFDDEGNMITAGINMDAPDCKGCQDVEMECLDVSCVKPLEPHLPRRMTACLCVSESLMFSAPYVLEPYLKLLSTAFAALKEQNRLCAIRDNSYVRTFDPPYGIASGVHEAAARVMALLNQSRFGGTGGYTALLPKGMGRAVLADYCNRLFGTQHGFDDFLSKLRDMGVTKFVETPDVCPTAPGEPPITFTGALGNAGSAPLEAFHQTPTIYFFKEESMLTSSVFQTEYGIDTTPQAMESVASGCKKMIMSEWWIDPFRFGCDPAIAVDFTKVCAGGTGPDAIAPDACQGSVPGERQAALTGGDAPLTMNDLTGLIRAMADGGFDLTELLAGADA